MQSIINIPCIEKLMIKPIVIIGSQKVSVDKPTGAIINSNKSFSWQGNFFSLNWTPVINRSIRRWLILNKYSIYFYAGEEED